MLIRHKLPYNLLSEKSSFPVSLFILRCLSHYQHYLGAAVYFSPDIQSEEAYVCVCFYMYTCIYCINCIYFFFFSFSILCISSECVAWRTTSQARVNLDTLQRSPNNIQICVFMYVSGPTFCLFVFVNNSPISTLCFLFIFLQVGNI